jgi:RES domain-containing protein
VLEVRVHLDLPPELLPDDYVLVTIDISNLAVEDVAFMPADAQVFGDTWIREQRTPVLYVPSVIVPENKNILVNPSHPAATGARIVGKRRFEFDRRLWHPV